MLQLCRRHFTQSLVALHLVILASLLDDIVKQLMRGRLRDWFVHDAACLLRGRFGSALVRRSLCGYVLAFFFLLCGRLAGIFDYEWRLKVVADLEVLRH